MRIWHALGVMWMSCCVSAQEVDWLITNGLVYDGSLAAPRQVDIAVDGDRIVALGQGLAASYQAERQIDAGGMMVAPGFIDPHTHSWGDLLAPATAANLNYLTQGVTTVFNGNDGGGPVAIEQIAARLEKQGIGTNTAFFVGHGTVRKAVMGKAERQASPVELEKMRKLVASAMAQGALGLSSGLYYVPGSYASTDEVVALAKVAAESGGIYESHIRDESTYNIGLVAAVDEALTIGRRADIPVHLAHIKALGVDVWGKSADVVALVEKAQGEGVKVTADQYPWLASGTHVSNALFPKWSMADSTEHFHGRLREPALTDKLRSEVTENLRKRGGPEALLLVADTKPEWQGKTLAAVAKALQQDPVSAAFAVVLAGDARVASFTMHKEDVERFMAQPWVMTSSDGTRGHPRKYASFPQKYQEYVKQQPLLSASEFVHRSSGLVADTFGLAQRGYLRPGYFADIIIIDPETYAAKADFGHPERLSLGIEHLWVNGQQTLAKGQYNGNRNGRVLKRR